MVEKLNLATDSITGIKGKWPHLSDLELPDGNADIQILIGSDCVDLILPLELRSVPTNTPSWSENKTWLDSNWTCPRLLQGF